MTLNMSAKKQLKAKAHKLNVIVTVGNNGLTENVNKEIDRALYDHELIKIRVITNDRDEKKAIFAEIVEQHRAELIQQIGFIGVLYRESDKDK